MWSTDVGFTLQLIIPVHGSLSQLSREHWWNMVYFTSTVIILVCFSFLGGADASLWAWRCELQPLLLSENRGESRNRWKNKRWSSFTHSDHRRKLRKGGPCRNCYSVVPGNQIRMTLMSFICVVWLHLLIIPLSTYCKCSSCTDEFCWKWKNIKCIGE